MSEPRIATRSLHAGYGEIPVIRGINLEVNAGEVVALLGPNGAGKTTTLLALAGECTIQDGAVEFLGQPARGRLDDRVRAGMAYLPEERNVFPHLTVAQNVRLGRGTPAKAYEFGPELHELRSRLAGLCSGGEQQILVLARALAADPLILLADEISLGLAPKIVDRVLNAIRDAAKTSGLSALIVEQHARQALRVADRGYVLRRGEVVLEGEASDLLARIDEVEEAYFGVAETPSGS